MAPPRHRTLNPGKTISNFVFEKDIVWDLVRSIVEAAEAKPLSVVYSTERTSLPQSRDEDLAPQTRFDTTDRLPTASITMQSVPYADPQAENHIRERFQRFGLDKLFDAGVEARGIDRVPEDEREQKPSIGLLVLWFGFNTTVGTIPVGMLAQPVFRLTLAHAAAVILGFGLIGCTAIGFIATLGPRLGMRTMVLTRYAYGYWGGAIIALLNVLTQLGFSTLSVILSGQVLHTVNQNLPLAAGVVVVGVISLFVCFIGYDLLHHYERYAWLIVAVVFILICALGGHAGYQPSLQASLESPPGSLRAADVLSYGGILFSSVGSWATVGADYNCRLLPDTSTTKIFTLTLLGNLIPYVLIVTLGAALMTVPEYAAAYEAGDAADVLKAVFQPWGKGGDFLLVLLALSIVASNVANTYSTALSMQTLIPAFRRIPRALFTILAFAIYTVAAVAGREHFSVILSNFLAVLGYWIAFWIIIVAEEHLIFRGPEGMLKGYDVQAYDTPSLLPVGIAAIIASLFGIAGAVLSMAQTWYVGPIATKLGPLGGDIGFEFAAALAGFVYPPLRWLEIRKLGR